MAEKTGRWRRAGRACGSGWLRVTRADADWRAKRNSAPFPLFRWLAALGIVVWTATGGTHTISEWAASYAPWLIVAGVLAFGPEIASITIGGLKMELLRQNKAEIEKVGAQLQQLQIAQASAVSQSSASASSPVTVIVSGANQAGEAATANKAVTPAADLLGRYRSGGRTMSSTGPFASPAGGPQGSTISS